MIAKLERIPKQRPTQNLHKQWELQNTIKSIRFGEAILSSFAMLNNKTPFGMRNA